MKNTYNLIIIKNRYEIGKSLVHSLKAYRYGFNRSIQLVIVEAEKQIIKAIHAHCIVQDTTDTTKNKLW